MNDQNDLRTTPTSCSSASCAGRRAARSVPERSWNAGRESLTWRSVDAELAALLSDTSVEDERLALVRSAAGVRAVAFEADDLAIELDILGDGAHRTLVGQLVPAGTTEIEVQRRGDPIVVAADRYGRFRAENVPEGRMRLRITGHPETAGPAETSWITI